MNRIKKNYCIITLILLCTIILSSCTAGQSSLTSDSFNDCFEVKVSTETKIVIIPLNDPQNEVNVEISIFPKKGNNKYCSCVIDGFIQAKVDKNHSLYKDGILPLKAIINIDKEGYGKSSFTFSYSDKLVKDDNYYFEFVSLS